MASGPPQGSLEEDPKPLQFVYKPYSSYETPIQGASAASQGYLRALRHLIFFKLHSSYERDVTPNHIYTREKIHVIPNVFSFLRGFHFFRLHPVLILCQ